MRVPASAMVLAALLVTGCGGPTTTAPPAPPASSSAGDVLSPVATADRVVGWRSDLNLIVPDLVGLHPDPFHGTARSVIDGRVAELATGVPTMTDDAILTGVMRVVALVSAKGQDGHTGAFIWGEGTYPLHSLPLRLWLFPKGVYVVAALPPYEDLVGSRVIGWAGHPIADVLAAIEPLVPRDNVDTVRLIEPRFLLIPEVLHGLGLVGDSAAIEVQTARDEGSSTSQQVSPIPMAAYNSWAGAYGLDLPADPAVLWLSRSSDTLWFRDLDSGTVYVQYNRVQPVDNATLDELSRSVRRPGVGRVIVDVRNNYGGEMQDLDAVIAAFKAPALAPSVQVLLLTGRNTFSAGSLFAARLQALRPVTVIGEPAGGSPNFWDNPRSFSLPFSGLIIECSTGFDIGVRADDPRLAIAPDQPVELTAEDYFAARDPVLAAALASPLP